MTEISRPWAGTVTGDAGPYTDIQWQEVWQALIAPTIASEGVFDGQLNELGVTPGVNNAAMQTGRAMVDGSWYENDAVVNIVIPDAAANPRIDRIVLRKIFPPGVGAQTVRLTRIAGAEAVAPTPPAITQNPGVTWDLPLWQLYMAVAVGGTPVAYVDERSMIGQYEPAGYMTAIQTYVEDDFFEGGNWANAENRRIWTANIPGGSINPYAATNSGVLNFTHSGVAAQALYLTSQWFRPDGLNARTMFRAASPNTDANLDKVLGYVANAAILSNWAVCFRNIGANNWFAVTRNGGVETAVDTGIAPTAAFKVFEIRQRGTTAVEYYIDGVLVAVITTNIPAVGLLLAALVIDDGGGCANQAYLYLDKVRVIGGV